MNPSTSANPNTPDPITPVPTRAVLPAMLVQVQQVTPRLALHWLEQRDQEYQRRLDEAFAQRLADDMLHGAFENTQSITFHHCRERGDERFLTNGQHRLRGIVLSERPQELPIVEKWVYTWTEVQEAYGHIDRGRTRTHQDVFRALGLDSELGLNGLQVALFGPAVGVLLRGFLTTGIKDAGSTRDPMHRVQVMREWIAEAQAIFALYEGLPSKARRQVLNAMPLALALVTFRYVRAKAERFWREVAWGEGLTVADTTYHLREYLSAESTRGRLSERQIMWAIARAWNAYYHGRTITIFRHLDKPGALELDGTPYNGKDLKVRG